MPKRVWRGRLALPVSRTRNLVHDGFNAYLATEGSLNLPIVLPLDLVPRCADLVSLRSCLVVAVSASLS